MRKRKIDETTYALEASRRYTSLPCRRRTSQDVKGLDRQALHTKDASRLGSIAKKAYSSDHDVDTALMTTSRTMILVTSPLLVVQLGRRVDVGLAPDGYS